MDHDPRAAAGIGSNLLQTVGSGVPGGAPGGGSSSSPFMWPGGPPFGSLTAFLAAAGAGAPPGVGAGAWPGAVATRSQGAASASAGAAQTSSHGNAVTGSYGAAPTAPYGTAPTPGWAEWWMAYGGPENPIPITGASPAASAECVNDRLPARATSFRGRGSSIPGRGGRAPRAPPTAPARSAPVDIDLTDPRDCGAVLTTNEHFTASLIFTKKSEREMFMTLDTREERFDWLKRKHEWFHHLVYGK